MALLVTACGGAFEIGGPTTTRFVGVWNLTNMDGHPIPSADGECRRTVVGPVADQPPWEWGCTYRVRGETATLEFDGPGGYGPSYE